MPILEDYGTLKNVSFADRWTSDFGLTPTSNYDELSGTNKEGTLLIPFSIIPYYWTIKCRYPASSSSSFALRIRTGKNSYTLTVKNDQVGWATWYMVDMTITRVIEFLPKPDDSGCLVYIDGVLAMTLIPSNDPNPSQLRIRSGPVSGAIELYFNRVHRKSLALINWYWLAFLQKKVMDPGDRDDPDDFISKRFPVATYPTEILKPRIDFHIKHTMKKRPTPLFPHFYADSTVTISAYIKHDTAVEGVTNVDAVDLICSLIHDALHYVYDEIDILKDYSTSDPVFHFDERNSAWVGRVAVRALHFVEVF